MKTHAPICRIMAFQSHHANDEDDDGDDDNDDDNNDSMRDETVVEQLEVLRRTSRTEGQGAPDYSPPPYSGFCAIQDPSSDPITLIREAVLWRKAMQEEMNALALNETWTLTELPKHKKAISSKWVFKTKRDAHGAVTKCKARVVVRGC